MNDRKALKFYRSYYEIAKELPEQDRLNFLWALLQKQFENIDTELTGLARFAYISQEHSINAQIQGYLDKINTPNKGGSKGGMQGGIEAPSVQEKEKEKEKEQYVKPKAHKQPTINEVKDYFQLHGYLESVAVRAFNYYDVADWKDSKGNKVKNWKQKMQSVWFKDENKIIIVDSKPEPIPHWNRDIGVDGFTIKTENNDN